MSNQDLNGCPPTTTNNTCNISLVFTNIKNRIHGNAQNISNYQQILREKNLFPVGLLTIGSGNLFSGAFADFLLQKASRIDTLYISVDGLLRLFFEYYCVNHKYFIYVPNNQVEDRKQWTEVTSQIKTFTGLISFFQNVPISSPQVPKSAMSSSSNLSLAVTQPPMGPYTLHVSALRKKIDELMDERRYCFTKYTEPFYKVLRYNPGFSFKTAPAKSKAFRFLRKKGAERTGTVTLTEEDLEELADILVRTKPVPKHDIDSFKSGILKIKKLIKAFLRDDDTDSLVPFLKRLGNGKVFFEDTCSSAAADESTVYTKEKDSCKKRFICTSDQIRDPQLR